MKATSTYSDLLEQFKDDIHYITEQSKLVFTEELVEIMIDKDISRADLATRMGVSKAFVTRILNGRRELTIMDCVAVGKAVDCDFFIGLRCMGQKKKKRK